MENLPESYSEKNIRHGKCRKHSCTVLSTQLNRMILSKPFQQTSSLLPCPPGKDPGFWKQVPEETFLHLLAGAQDQWLDAEQDQLLATVKRWKLAWFECVTQWQPSQNSPSRHLGQWVRPWSVLDGQHQRVDIPAYARTAHRGLLQKRLEKDLFWTIPHPESFIMPRLPLPQQTSRSRDWNEPNVYAFLADF